MKKNLSNHIPVIRGFNFGNRVYSFNRIERKEHKELKNKGFGILSPLSAV
jgi:hypothetical protein